MCSQLWVTSEITIRNQWMFHNGFSVRFPSYREVKLTHTLHLADGHVMFIIDPISSRLHMKAWWYAVPSQMEEKASGTGLQPKSDLLNLTLFPQPCYFIQLISLFSVLSVVPFGNLACIISTTKLLISNCY